MYIPGLSEAVTAALWLIFLWSWPAVAVAEHRRWKARRSAPALPRDDYATPEGPGL